MGYTDQTITSIFGTLDLNGDGEISREELRQSFERYEHSALRLALALDTAVVFRRYTQFQP